MGSNCVGCAGHKARLETIVLSCLTIHIVLSPPYPRYHYYIFITLFFSPIFQYFSAVNVARVSFSPVF